MNFTKLHFINQYKFEKLLKRVGFKIEDIIYKKTASIEGYFSKNKIRKPYEVIYVPVDEIKSYVVSNDQLGRRRKFLLSYKRAVGEIKDGNWDLSIGAFENIKDMIAIKERYTEKKSWEETVYFRYFNENIELQENHNGETWKRGAKTWEEFKEKCLNKWDLLYEDVRVNGYKSQKQLRGRPENEIEVAISRNKEILFIDGRHRLAIAKVIGIKFIPVVVNVWHKEFINSNKIHNLTPSQILKK